MFTLVLYKPYKVKWFKGEGGVKKGQSPKSCSRSL